MRFRHVAFDPQELIPLKVDPEETTDGRTCVTFAGGEAYTMVTEDDALAIAEAWRAVEQQILERRHGVLETL